MRLFVAVWPSQAAMDHLELALDGVRAAGAATDIRWAARETWHLTTAFYGTVADGAVPELVDALGQAAAGLAPYELGLRGAGVFAHRTLWLGAGGDVTAHRAVVVASGAAGEAVGVTPDHRPRDRPHLTVGRVRPVEGARRASRGGTARGGTGRGPARDLRRRPPVGGGAGGAGESGRGRAAAGASGGADGLVRALAVYEGPRWTVREVALVRSEPGAGRGGGPLYETVATVRLGPTG